MTTSPVKSRVPPGRIVFFLEGKDVPSTRYRVEQYESVLHKHEVPFIKCYSWPAKFSHYPQMLAGSPLRFALAAAATLVMMVTRFIQILRWSRGASVIVFQRDLLHGVQSALLEKALASMARVISPHVRIVFDVDDAIFMDRRHTKNSSAAKKMAAISDLSDTIIAGNQFLADHFPAPRTLVIPTILDLARYPVKSPQSFSAKGAPLVLGWTGSRSTSAYLEVIAKPLSQFIKETNSRLLMVCEKTTLLPPGIPIASIIPWSRETEIQALLTFDAGLMPLPDDAWSRGKCGLKLLQYSAVGIPSIASRVGVNPLMIVEGQTGYLASTEDDWYRFFVLMNAERARLSSMGKLARRNIENSYSLDRYGERWLGAVLGMEKVR